MGNSFVDEIDDAHEEGNLLSQALTNRSKLNVLISWDGERSWYFWHSWFNEEELS